MNKVQLTLTNEETAILSSYGRQFGYSLPKTIKFIISKTAESYLKEQAASVDKTNLNSDTPNFP